MITVRPQSPRPPRSPLERVIADEKRTFAIAQGRRPEFFQPAFDVNLEEKVTVEPAKESTQEQKRRKSPCVIL